MLLARSANSPAMMPYRRVRLRDRYCEIEFLTLGARRASEIATASSPSDRLMFLRNRAWSESNPSTALLIQIRSTFLLSVSSSRRKAGFLSAFFEEEQDRSSKSVSRL